MAEPTPAVPDAIIKEKRRLSAVWFIPIVAVVIGAYLTIRSVAERGPTFTVTFSSADGLEAGKTKIRFRELELGVVESLALADDLSHVIATARIAPTYARFLKEKTRFWVVRARVTAGNVSGLSTLLSGAYIGIDPVASGKDTTHFRGLEQPPLVTTQETGTRFVLRADRIGSLDVGAPVLYRQLHVGEVTRTALTDDGEGILINVYVHAPYDKRVRNTTKWWNASGFDATINQNGLRLETESFISMLIGGVAFDHRSDAESDAAPPDTEFQLYPNRAATEAPVYQLRERFMAFFDGSVKGLERGSVVEFRGIPIGQVIDVALEYNPANSEVRVPVILEIEPERFNVLGDDPDAGPSVVRQAEVMVERGMRARLESGNLLTGSLVVALEFYPKAKPAVLKMGGPYPELPTLPKRLDELAANVSKLVEKFDRVPMEEMVTELAGALAALRGTLEQTQAAGKTTNADILPRLAGTIDEAQETLKTVQKTLAAAEKTATAAGRLMAPSSTVNTELARMLSELTDTTRSVRLLVEQLDRKPESLIMGRKEK